MVSPMQDNHSGQADENLDKIDNGTPESGGMPMIEADRLSKFYGVFTACRDVSFKVHRG